MNIVPRDISGSRALAPLDVAEYLRTAGWQPVEVYSDGDVDRAAVWAAPDDSVEVYVPLRVQARDYDHLLAHVINQVADVEGRPAHQILADIRTTRADVVRVRKASAAADGRLPLAAGPVLFAATADLMIAAASAAVEPRSAYSGRRSRRVQDFSEHASFGHTEEGSFVVRVVVPLPPRLAPRQTTLPVIAGESRADLPFNRQVTEMLLSAVRGAYRAATRAMLERSLEPFREQVKHGVSADLCKALAAMASEDSLIEISVAWSRAWPAPAPDARPIGFSRDVLDVLGEAAGFLGEAEPREDFELTGFVSHLHREPGQGPGEITVVGDVDGRSRKIRVVLDERDYELAVEAHRREDALALIGDLRKDGRQYRLERPRRLRLVPEPAVDDV